MGTAPRSAARACARRRPSCLLRARSRARPRRARHGRLGEVPAPRDALSEPIRSDFSILYLGSTWLPRDLRPLLWLARRRRIPLVVNQNGVGYPGWAGADTEAVNRPLRLILAQAEHVLYQSEFCKRAADEWVAEPGGIVGDPSQRRRRRALHAGSAASGGRARPACSAAINTRRTGSRLRSRPLAALLPEHPDDSAPRDGSARHSRRATRRATRPRGTCPRARALLAGRRARDPPARSRPAAHEGQRPVPESRDRGDGERASRRLRAQRRRARARRRRRRDRRRASGWLRARRAAERRGARRGSRARARRPTDVRGGGTATSGRALRARAVARSSRRRSSSGCRARRSHECVRGTWRGRSARAPTSRPTSDTNVPPRGRTSMRATTRSGIAVLAQQVADARAVAQADARVVLANGRAERRGCGSYSIRAPDRTARMR